jgi:hypothetical protein
MTLNQFRSLLYKLARGLGDVNAVKRGTVGRRIARRGARAGGVAGPPPGRGGRGGPTPPDLVKSTAMPDKESSR